MTIDFVPMYPLTDGEADSRRRAEARRIRNRWFLEPVLRSRVSGRTCSSTTPTSLPPIEDGDMSTIAAPLDFLGVNYYTRNVIRAGVDRRRARARPDSTASSTRRWAGRSIRAVSTICCVRLHDEYDASAAVHHGERRRVRREARQNGSVPDPRRISYLEGHLDAVAASDRAGRARARVLPLVAARQLRVGFRIHEAVRHRLRRLRDARARAEGELWVVPRFHRGAPRGTA